MIKLQELSQEDKKLIYDQLKSEFTKRKVSKQKVIIDFFKDHYILYSNQIYIFDKVTERRIYGKNLDTKNIMDWNRDNFIIEDNSIRSRYSSPKIFHKSKLDEVKDILSQIKISNSSFYDKVKKMNDSKSEEDRSINNLLLEIINRKDNNDERVNQLEESNSR